VPEAHPNNYDPSPGNSACRIFIGASHTRTQGVEIVSTSSQTLQEAASIHEFFNLVATETLALFEHLDFEFLTEYDVFAPARVVCVTFDHLNRMKRRYRLFNHRLTI
jgi:hypothetical protein